MNQDKLKPLFNRHILSAKTVSEISREILYLIECSMIDDEEAKEKLSKLSSRKNNILTTFLKVSDMMFKSFLMEHRLSGTKLIKELELDSSSRSNNTQTPTEGDIEIMKHYINQHENNKNENNI